MTNEILEVSYIMDMWNPDEDADDLWFQYWYFDAWMAYEDGLEWLTDNGFSFDPETNTASNYTTEDLDAAFV